MKEQILKEFEDKYSSFELCNQVSKPELDKLKYFISKAIEKTREETIKELIGMCVNFDDYNNDKIISKEMLEELLNKLKK